MSETLLTNPAKEAEDLLVVRNLKKYYPVKSGVLQRVTDHVLAVDDVSFTVKQGETLGLVGESGCGKTTISMGIMAALMDAGRIQALPASLIVRISDWR